ncbi:MAG: hypothetical protein ACRDIV_02405 [Ktedonobacteraceae bacterium]
MPRLVQKENGDYCIRAYSHSKDGIDTWQVRDLGLTYLERKGVYAGKTFPAWQLQEMIESNWVFIGGSDIHSKNAVIQNRPIISATASARNSPFTKNPFQIIPTRSPQKSKSNIQRVVNQPSHNIGKTTSLVFRKYKKRWELLIVFPKLNSYVSERLFARGFCSLTVEGAIHTLKIEQLQRNYTYLAVMPQEMNYGIKLISTSSSRTDLRPLLMDLKNSSICEVKGLSLLGTVFKKHKEALSSNEDIRLEDHKAMVLGDSYYVVFHKASVPKSVPDTLAFKSLGDVGMWEAWEIQLPLKAEVVVRDWVTRLGHRLN